MKHKYILLVFSIFSFISPVCAQSGKVYAKTNIKKGVLKNGLTYYLYNNPRSRGHVNFYLVQNVGAVLEDDSQDGLAHFLEHMCFKGTKNFPDNTIMETLKKQGLISSINAYTGLESTVYHITDIPSSKRALLDKSLVILHDWCNELLLEPSKIEAERSVIVEEMRTRRNLALRIKEKTYPYLLNGSEYSKRFVCGTPEIIKNFKRDNLVKFYKDWYRADLQAVVVVGDIDEFEMETKINNLFSSIPMVKDAKPRPKYIIPDNKETYYVQVKDKEIKQGKVGIYFRHDNKVDVDNNFIRIIINQMLRARVYELVKIDTSNLYSATLANLPVVDNYANYEISVIHKKDKAKCALASLLGMHKDIVNNGFTDEEFKFVTERILKELKQYKDYWNYFPNEQLFKMIRNNFILGLDILDGTSKYKRVQHLIKNLTLEDINTELKKWYSGPNKSIVVLCNGKDKQYLTKQEVLEIEKNAEERKVLPKKENKISENLNLKIIDKEPETTKIKVKKNVGILDAEMWTLANGAKVVYKECNAVPDLISINAVSEGGFSVLNGDNLANAAMFRDFSSVFGLGNFTKEQLQLYMKELEIGYNLSIDKDGEYISGGCRYKNVDKMFQMLYSIFENPTFYEDEYNKIFSDLKRAVKNQPNDYESKLMDTINFYKNGRDRYFKFNESFLNKISFENIKKIYNNRFSDASNFTFYIIGGIGRSSVKKLVNKYIGTITSTNSKETYRKLVNKFPRGYNKLKLNYEMIDKKAGNIYLMNSIADTTDKADLAYFLIESYLLDKVNKVLRFGMNGTYGAKINKYISTKSLNSCGFDLQYDCDPERVVELNKALNATIAIIAKNGMQQQDLDILMKPYKGMKTNQYMDNDFCYEVLKKYIEKGVDMSSPDFMNNIIDSIDLKYMNTLIKNFFKSARILDIVFVPKE